MVASKITTIKIQRSTKSRIDHLRVYRRETYDEILQEMLAILNLCKNNPLQARQRLLQIDRKTKSENKKVKQKPENSEKRENGKSVFDKIMKHE